MEKKNVLKIELYKRGVVKGSKRRECAGNYQVYVKARKEQLAYVNGKSNMDNMIQKTFHEETEDLKQVA